MRHEFRNLMLCPYSRGTTCKRDMFDAAASNVNASIGAFSSLGTDLFNYFSNKETNEMNQAIAAKNNETSIKIARENNELQRSMNEYNNMFASREAEKAWARQIQWNNPVNQMRLLKEAGINPSVYFGSHGSAAGSAVAPAAAPHGSGISPSMPTLTTPQMKPFFMSNPAEGFKMMADAVAKLSESRKTDEEAKRLEKTFDKYIEGFNADVEMKKNAAFLQSAFGFVKESLVVAKMKNELAQGTEIVNNLKTEGKFKEAQIALTRSQQRASEAAAKLSQKQREQVEEQIKAYGKIVTSQINESQARTNQANAQARFTEQQRKDLADMHDYNVNIRRSQSQLSLAEVQKVGATLYQEIDYLLGHFDNLSELERAQLQSVQVAANRAHFEYDMRWINWSLDTIERINNGVNKWAPWALSRTDNVLTTNDTLYDGSTMKTETRTSGYKPAWKK